MSQEVQPAVPGPTTIAVSIPFANALKEIAKSKGISVAAYCDATYLSDAAALAADAIRKRLADMERAKGGN